MNTQIVKHSIIGLSLLAITNQGMAADMDEITGKISKTISTMKNLMLAKQVAQLGFKEKDPLSLVVAYNIAKNSPPEKSKALTNLISGKANNQSSARKVDYLDVLFSKKSKLIDKAKVYAKDNSDMLALIGDAIADSARGAGEQVVSDTLAANSVNKYELTYTTDEIAGIYVEETENAGLLLSVVDNNNKTICDNNNVSDSGFCSWMPTGNGNVTITINNSSAKDVTYYMLTN